MTETTRCALIQSAALAGALLPANAVEYLFGSIWNNVPGPALSNWRTVPLPKSTKPNKSMQQLLRLLQLNLFEKPDLMALLRGNPPTKQQVAINHVILL